MPEPIQLPPTGDVLAAVEALPPGGTLLLPRGQTFNVPAGRGPLVMKDGQTLGAYGDRATHPRPRVVFTGDKTGVDIGGNRDVKLDSLQILAIEGGRFTGVEIHHADNVVIGNCVIAGWRMNVTAKTTRSLVVRGSLIADAWRSPAATLDHAQGLYAYDTTGILLDSSAFVRNGYRPGRTRPTIYNHGVYLYANCGPAAVRDCAFVANSSHGIQMRSGGDIAGCLFWDNPIGLSHGVVNRSEVRTGGVAGTVERLVFVGGATIDGAKRGYAAEFGNAAGTIARDLVAAHETTQLYDVPYLINPSQHPTGGTTPVSPSRIDMTRLFAYDWPGHPDRRGVLRDATRTATGAREQIEARALPPGVNLRSLLGDVEAAARRDPWSCARNGVKAARIALLLEVNVEEVRARLREIATKLTGLAAEDARAAQERLRLEAAQQARAAERAALESERARLQALLGGNA